jgi:hypothetical protein
MRAGCEALGVVVAGAMLLQCRTALAETQPPIDVGARAGVSINNDQWVLGGFLRYGRLCPFVCLGDLGASVHALVGVGGNRTTVRLGIRLDSLLWFDRAHTVALYPVAGASAQVLVPVGHFAEFCARTGLEGCGGRFWGAELGGGLRVWRLFLEGVVGTGEFPIVTATMGMVFPAWKAVP